MFSHFTLGSNDIHRSQIFYTAVMETLGQSLLETSDNHDFQWYGAKDKRHPHLFICRPFDALPATWSNGYHIAFNTPDTESVDRFYRAALDHGGIDDGAPGIRAIYAPDYYGAYVRDPDGNKLQAVCYTRGRTHGDTGDIISHITIGHCGLIQARAFYDAILEPLNIVELLDEGDSTTVGYGIAGRQLPVIYVQPPFDGRPATWGNGTHTALSAESEEAVNRFHAAALAHGGSCDGPPGSRPQYSAQYYAAYVRDPVGNKLQAVYRAPRAD